jgi:predicted nucleic-acid-binding Zn-ribbon protein
MNQSPCPKCQSTEFIPDVRVIDHADLNAPMDLGATIYREPDAWVFKMPILHRFHAQVCGACGYTEFYVENPQRLLELAKKAAGS